MTEYDRLLQLLSRHTATPVHEPTPATRLAQDLGTDGDDAVDFFAAYAREFGVDLYALEWDKHFGPEGWGCALQLVIWPAVRLVYRESPPEVPHTVQDLLDGVRAGEWVAGRTPE